MCRGVGTGPAGPATAGPMFPEPTIKNIIPLFAIKQIEIFMLQLHVYAILIKELHKILIFLKRQLCYKLGTCKNNSRSLRVKLNNGFSKRFLLISWHQVPKVQA